MASETVLTLDQDNFEEKVLKSSIPVLVDFWAPWCGPCRMAGPIIDELAEDYEGKLIVGKVNVDENSDLGTKYKVMSIPTVTIFKNGEVVDKLIGSVPRERYEDMIDSNL